MNVKYDVKITILVILQLYRLIEYVSMLEKWLDMVLFNWMSGSHFYGVLGFLTGVWKILVFPRNWCTT